MKKALLRKSIVATTLLLVLAFGVTSINAPVARADKFPPVEQIGPGDVIFDKVKSGCTVTFVPDPGYHISAIQVGTNYLSSIEETIAFESQKDYRPITVYFGESGNVIVPEGEGVTVFLDPSVGLSFEITSGGGVTGADLLGEVAEGNSVVVWKIETTTGLFEGQVLVALQYDDNGLTDEQEQNLRVIRGPTLEAVISDVNKDARVDGTDVSIVANAVKQGEWYNPICDLNNDGYVTELDLAIVNANKGAESQDITYWIDIENNVAYAITSAFSIVFCR